MKSVSNLPFLANLLLLLVMTETAIAEQCDVCDSEWHKVYEVDDQGKPFRGSYDALLAAAKQAEPIRYLIPSLGEEGYAGNCEVTFVKTRFIMFLSTSYVSKASWKTFEEEPYHRLLRMTTTGDILEIRYLVNNFMQIKQRMYKAAIHWFVKNSSCLSLLLGHNRNGKVTNGSSDKLISSILSGHDITETWMDTYTELCRIITVTKHGMVVGQFIWDVVMTDSPAWSFMNVYSTGQAVRNSFSPGETHITRITKMMSGRWYADSCWKHVFTNDENGGGIDGSLSDLICAINRGHRVKVIMGNFSTEADNVRTKSGQISAQLLNRLYAQKANRKFRGFWKWQMVHTTGTVATLKYRLFNGTSAGEKTEKKKIKWFVDTKPWKKVLTTNKKGDVVFGSKSKLRIAVQFGSEVRVALKIDDSKPDSNRPKKRQVVCWEKEGEGGCLWDKHGRPCAANGKPDEGNGKPDEGNGKPDEGSGKPDEGTGKPDEGTGKPDEGQAKPDEGQDGGNGGSDECTTQGWALFKTSNLELGPSGEVSAELLQSVSTEEVGSKELKIKKDAYWKYMIVTTQGDVDVSQRGIGVNRNDGHFSVKYATNWFVNY